MIFLYGIKYSMIEFLLSDHSGSYTYLNKLKSVKCLLNIIYT